MVHKKALSDVSVFTAAKRNNVSLFESPTGREKKEKTAKLLIIERVAEE
jgi:hypothetical protein